MNKILAARLLEAARGAGSCHVLHLAGRGRFQDRSEAYQLKRTVKHSIKLTHVGVTRSGHDAYLLGNVGRMFLCRDRLD